MFFNSESQTLKIKMQALFTKYIKTKPAPSVPLAHPFTNVTVSVSVMFNVIASIPKLNGISTQHVLVAVQVVPQTKSLIKQPVSVSAFKVNKVVLLINSGTQTVVNASVKIRLAHKIFHWILKHVCASVKKRYVHLGLFSITRNAIVSVEELVNRVSS